MRQENIFDVIIIGGSYSGLSAAMALGRSLRKVLVIDAGQPCNRFTPHSHNFITHDGRAPEEIAALAREQVQKYESITFYDDLAIAGKKVAGGFEIEVKGGTTFQSKKLIFATGLKDIMPEIPGFKECWGKSIIHCPYCHGYEVRDQKTGILGNGEIGFHYAQLISNWTSELVLITNGKLTLTADQTQKLNQHRIEIIAKKIDRLEHTNGKVSQVLFKDQSSIPLQAIYTRPDFEQHSDIPEKLGCEINEMGLIKTDQLNKTSVEGVFACGDNSNMRSVSVAVSSGSVAGAAVNNELISETF